MNYDEKRGLLLKGEVIADLEHLRKLFIMPDSPDKFIEFGNELLNLIHSFFQDKGGIHSAISLPELAKIFSDTNLPKYPHLLKDVLSEIKSKVIAHSVKVGNPYYIGHMTSAIPYFMILLEMIIAALNQNQVKIETAKASSFVEREFIAWIHQLVFKRTDSFYKKNIQNYKIALGNITSDGTIGNLTGLLVARNKAFAANDRFPGIRKAGFYEAMRYYKYRKAVILVSRRGHYSIDKIARTIGIGQDNVIRVPVDSMNKIDIKALQQTMGEIKQFNDANDEKIKIISIVGIAGTTETGNIDDLVELKKAADETTSHFHVDAAWGGAVLLVDDYKYMLKGIERADSVTFDAHKLLYSPLSMGMVLFRNEKDLDNIKHSSSYVLRPDSVDQGRFTVEGSRPFSCLKPWATLKIMGTEGFRLLFGLAFKHTNTIKNLVDKHENFEAMSTPELFIFTYRFVPGEIKEKLNLLMSRIEQEPDKSGAARQKVRKINNMLNTLNVELHRYLREEDNSFVSRTRLESTRYYPQKVVVLRSVTVNPLTTDEIIKEIIDEQNTLGIRIYKLHFANNFLKLS
ncbi:MAG: aminotransferase class V-fold PLP-dependent enzyme [Spirochaetes bacterium]|nr:aminotransferase class V-fold PLP-dependent enzyme [Spirochaetota bacterium]